MTSAGPKIAILHPSDLLGKELIEELERRGSLAGRLSLYTTDEEEVGTLADVRGEVAVVQRYTEGDLEGIDVAFFCGGIEAMRPLLADLPVTTTGIVLSPDATGADGVPVISGINDDRVIAGSVFLSPHPAAILLARLLEPLLPLGLESAVATVLLPASLLGKAALDELFEQARAMLSFSTQPREIFGRQLVFNLYPPQPGVTQLAALVRETLNLDAGGQPVDLAVQAVQAGVFHGVATSLRVSFGEERTAAEIRAALAARPLIDFAVDEEAPAPVDAAARGEIVASEITPDEPSQADGARGFWIWAVMDNLTVGGAANAVDLGEIAALTAN